jgi:hypothetical protein
MIGANIIQLLFRRQSILHFALAYLGAGLLCDNTPPRPRPQNSPLSPRPTRRAPAPESRDAPQLAVPALRHVQGGRRGEARAGRSRRRPALRPDQPRSQPLHRPRAGSSPPLFGRRSTACRRPLRARPARLLALTVPLPAALHVHPAHLPRARRAVCVQRRTRLGARGGIRRVRRAPRRAARATARAAAGGIPPGAAMRRPDCLE